jgi:hypothetical protein
MVPHHSPITHSTQARHPQFPPRPFGHCNWQLPLGGDPSLFSTNSSPCQQLLTEAVSPLLRFDSSPARSFPGNAAGKASSPSFSHTSLFATRIFCVCLLFLVRASGKSFPVVISANFDLTARAREGLSPYQLRSQLTPSVFSSLPGTR